MTDDSKVELAKGGQVYEGFDKINQRTGQQKDYKVLTEAERAKGFQRPVRHSYVHVGPTVKGVLRDLTEEEKIEHQGHGYVKYEVYPETESPVCGRFWTKRELELMIGGCNAVTTMGLAIAETYARDPGFYGATFCATCRAHYPVGEFIWEGTDERVGS